MKSYVLCQQLFVMLLPLLAAGSQALAALPLRKACDTEIRKFQCDAKSESYAYDCLNKHQEGGVKDKGFRSRCFKAYAAYEKANGKGAIIESHQVEHPEHTK